MKIAEILKHYEKKHEGIKIYKDTRKQDKSKEYQKEYQKEYRKLKYIRR
jgi:hypothetical protein